MSRRVGLLIVALACLVALVSAGLTAEEIKSNVVEATMRFPRHKHLREDNWAEFVQHEPRLKRWEKENNTLEHDPINMEEHTVMVKDATENEDLSVPKSGFELVDLHPRLLPILRKIKTHGLSFSRSGPTTAGSWFLFLGGGNDETVEDKLAHALQGSDSFSLSSGEYFHYAFRCAGFVIRKGGPEGTKIEGAGFDNVAQRVHIDQDLQGQPLLDMKLTWVFRNPFIRLLNIWSPLHDVRLRPMAFADMRTVKRERDVVRYRANSTANAGGRFGSFKSDRLMSLYSDEHKWYWYPNVRFGQAIAFDTSSVPHSSFSLRGETLLSQVRKDIEDLKSSAADKTAICARNLDLKGAEGLSIDMEAFIGSALGFKRRLCEGRSVPGDIDAFLEYISRASLEIRCVTFVAPKTMVYNTAIIGAGVAVAIMVLLRNRKVGVSKPI